MNNIKKCHKIEEIRSGSPQAYEKMLLGQTTEFDGHVRSCPDCSAGLKEARAIESGLKRALNSEYLSFVVVERNVGKIMDDAFPRTDESPSKSFVGQAAAKILAAFRRSSWEYGLSAVAAVVLIVIFTGIAGNGPENGNGGKSARVVDIGDIEPIKYAGSEISIKNSNGAVRISGAGTTRDLSGGKLTGAAAAIAEGDLIETSAGASCELAMAKGGYSLKPSSALKINKNGVDVLRGTVAFKFARNSFPASNPFAIETEMATVFILGTELEVSTGAGDNISLVEGKIAVSFKNAKIPLSVKMFAGQKMKIDKNSARLIEGDVPVREFTPENVGGKSLVEVPGRHPHRISDKPEIEATSEVVTQGNPAVVAGENAPAAETVEAVITGKNYNNDPNAFSFGASNENELTGEIPIVPESDLNIDCTNGYPSEAKWLGGLLDSREKYMKYKGISRIMFHKMYLKAKEEFEAKAKGLK